MNRLSATFVAIGGAGLLGIYLESFTAGFGIFGCVMAIVISGFGD